MTGLRSINVSTNDPILFLFMAESYSIVYMNHIFFIHPFVAAAAAKSLQSCLTLCDPIDGSPPSSPVPGILQARTLGWVATSFSNVWKWKVKVKSLSRVWLLATTWTAVYQAPPSMGFSRLRVLEWGAIAFSESSLWTCPNMGDRGRSHD